MAHNNKTLATFQLVANGYEDCYSTSQRNVTNSIWYKAESICNHTAKALVVVRDFDIAVVCELWSPPCHKCTHHFERVHKSTSRTYQNVYQLNSRCAAMHWVAMLLAARSCKPAEFARANSTQLSY
eukprot:8824-Heterococcus_DN1.PRE.3